MNKPVAIVELGGEVTWLTDVLPYKAKLYTHPVKELKLNEKEIDHIWFNYGWGEVEKEDLDNFARAILRKAQEK